MAVDHGGLRRSQVRRFDPNTVRRRPRDARRVVIRDPQLRVAIVHDDLTQRGGAEQVVLSLARLFPDAPIFTSVYDPDGTYEEFRQLDVRTTFLQRLPHRRNAARALLPLYPLAMRRVPSDDYDLVISSSSRFAHGVTASRARHICYCYSPARWLYDTSTYLTNGGPASGWVRPLITPILTGLRAWDQRAAKRPDRYVAISRAVAERIDAVYGRSADVIHPPVTLDRFAIAEASPGSEPDDQYYLVVSRLLPYKRVDLAIEACRRMGRHLVVVGDGPARSRLREMSGERVEFRSGVDDAALTRLLQGCVALIQAGTEDFGLGPIEANAAGRPAIARAAGGALETVQDGITGVHFESATPQALVEAMRRVEARPWNPAGLRSHAASFGEQRFHREFVRLLAEEGLIASPLSDRARPLSRAAR